MRKTFVIALVALSVSLVLASCDIIPTPGSGNAPDGLVKVKVNINEVGSDSRSLTLALAKDWDYIEVFMKDGPGGTEWVHGADSIGELFLTIKTGTYQVNESLILLGTASGTKNILQAAGRLDSSSLVVAPTTTFLTFNVTALKANLYADVVDGASSAFSISTDFTGDFAGFNPNSGTWTTGSYKCFQVPISKTNIAASLSIGGFASTDGLTVAGTDILMTAIPTVTFTRLSGSGSITSPTPSVPAAIGAIGAGPLAISFAFDSPATVSTYRITFEVPVVGISTNDDDVLGDEDGVEWVIRGGTEVGTDLTGSDSDNGIALKVWDPSAPPTPPGVEIGGPGGFVIGGEFED
jgi:hypothetical protein